MDMARKIVHTWKHVLLVGAFHGHVFIHLLDVEKLVFSQWNFRVGDNVLHVAVDYVVLDVDKEVAHDACDAYGREEALVPDLQSSYFVCLNQQASIAQRQIYQLLTPVMTSLPLVKSSAVHLLSNNQYNNECSRLQTRFKYLGLSMRMVMAANRRRS